MKKNMINWVLVFTLVVYGFLPNFVNNKVYALNVGDFSGDWKTVYPLNTNFDFLTDQQTGSGSVSQDIVGDETFHSFYVNYDEAANEIGYRIRINNADGNKKDEFTNFAFVGVEATNDGTIDFFLGAYRPSHSQGVIGIYNSDASQRNLSPNTTGIINPAIKIFTPVANVNYSLMQADSFFSGDPDYFITFKMPLNDLNLALKNAGKNIVIGESTPLRYIIGTSAQENAINQDIGGIKGLNSKETRSWEELGIFSPPVTIGGDVLNRGPLAVDDAVSMDEDKSVTVDVTANDTDADGDPIKIESYTQGVHGNVVLIDGKLVYTPVLNYYGEDTFTYSVSDGKGGVDTGTVTVTIASINDAPDASATATKVSTNFNEPVDGKIVATDVDGDPLQYSLAVEPSNGKVTVDPTTDEWTYSPNKGFSGVDEFEVEVSDGKGGRTTVKIQVTVNPANNKAPEALDDRVTVKEDGSVAVSVMANDTDADGEPMTIDSFTQGSHGTVSLVDGSLVYSPVSNYYGEDTFTYNVSDGNGGVDTAVVTVTVVSVNDVPNAVDDSVTVKEDESVTIDVIGNDIDADGDTLIVDTYSPGVHGTVSKVDGKLVYTPLPNYYGEDIFNYTVSDGKGGIGTATVTVTVASVNDAPGAVDDAVSVDEDKSVTVDVTANDTDAEGDSITIDAFTQGSHGTVSIVDGKLDYTPARNYFGEDTFTYMVRDGKGGLDTAKVTVTIASVNDVPEASATIKKAGTNFNEPLDGKIIAVDEDGDVLQYSLTDGPSNGTVIVKAATGDWTYTPVKGFSGEDEFRVKVSDGNGGSTTVKIQVTVNPANNNAPEAVDDGVTVNEDKSVTIDVIKNDMDADGDSITIKSYTQGSHGTVSLVDGKLSYLPESNYYGEDTFTYSVSDGNGGLDTAAVTVTVASVNDVPNSVDDAVSVKEDESVEFNAIVNDTDVDGDPLTIDTYTQGAHGTVSLVEGKLVYTPEADFNGEDTFTYTVRDGKGGVDNATVTVTVASVNDGPSAVEDVVTVKEDESVTVDVTVNDSDIDGDSIIIDTYSQAVHGTVSLVEGKLVYTPEADFNGEDTFTYTVRDGKGGVDTATVTVKVASVNDVPSSVDDAVSVKEDESVEFNAIVNDTDVDGDPLKIDTYTQGVHGTVSLVEGKLVYTPEADFNGEDTFTYTVRDGKGGVDTATVTVKVASVNDVPSSVDDAVSVKEDESVEFNAIVNDTDVDGDPLTIDTYTQGAHGTVSLVEDKLVYTPEADFNGEDTFTYTVRDGKGGVDTATVTVAVVSVNDVPNSVDDAVSVKEDESVEFNAIVNDTDVDGDPLTIDTYTQGAHGTVSLVEGKLVYTPEADFNGEDTFTYRVRDGKGGVDTATVTVKVASVNDGPSAKGVEVTTNYNETISRTIETLDVDKDTLQYKVAVAPSNGTVTLDPGTGSWTYTPNQGFTGNDQFDVEVSDGKGGSVKVQVRITVKPSSYNGGNDDTTSGENQSVIVSKEAQEPVKGKWLPNTATNSFNILLLGASLLLLGSIIFSIGRKRKVGK